MSLRTLSLTILLTLTLGCGDGPPGFEQPTLEQRLASGKLVRVTSCLLVWGAEHGERHTNQDSFALEYVTALPLSDSAELDREAREVFELIRPVSEQWGFATASLAAYPSVERSGKYSLFAFSRGTDGHWSFTRTTSKVFNTESGHKPGHP